MSDGETSEDIVVVSSGSEPEAKPKGKRANNRRKPAGKTKAAGDDAKEKDKWWAKRLDELDEPSDEELDIEKRTFPEREAPLALTTPLLPFQKESLHWMCEQEQSGFKGGILADEMGMGKTLQAIALILADKEEELAGADVPPVARGPRTYASEGTLKEKILADKEAAKAKRIADREAAKAAKLAAAAAKKASKGKKKDSSFVEDEDADDAAVPDASAMAASLDEFIKESLGHSKCASHGCEDGAFVSSWKPLKDITSPIDTLAPTRTCGTTLVVCPVVALTQWRSEIFRHTSPGALTVYIYHGPTRHASVEDLMKYDVVLTTYSILETEFRKMIEPSKQKCEWCGKVFLPEKLRIHLRYFCGPDAMKTAAQSKQQRKKDPVKGGAKKPYKIAVASSSEEEAEAMSSSSDSDSSSGSDSDSESSVTQVADSDTDSDVPMTKKKPVLVRAHARKSTGSVGGGSGKKSTPPTKQQQATPKSLSGAKRRLLTSSDKKKRGTASAAKKPRASASMSDGSDTETSDFLLSNTSSDSSTDSEALVAEGSTDSESGGGAGASGASARRRSTSASGSGSAKQAAAVKLGPISLLQQVNWKRIVLDEAHAIKNKRCTTAKAVFALTANHRWCLSGTPLQNRVAEMFSLIRFLRVKPYGFYFCKNCPCSSLDYRFDEGGRACELCGHSPLRHYNWLNRYVMNPIKQFGYFGAGKDAMVVLRKEVLDGMLLRRTKAGRSADLALPGRTILVREDLELDAFENDFYEALYTQSKAKFGAYVNSGTLLNNYAHIFDLLTRLRQAVDHPYLILYGAGEKPAFEDGSSSAAQVSDVCGICRESVEDPVLTGCRHLFCRMCMHEYLESVGGRATSLLKDQTNDQSAYVGEDSGEEGATPQKGAAAKRKARASAAAVSPGEDGGLAPKCPTCFADLTVDLTAQANPQVLSDARRKSILSRIPQDRVGTTFRSSTKIEALLQDLWRAQFEEPGCKAIVFSQFVNMLDLIQHRLAQAGVRCVKMDGSMSVAARDRVINAFREDPHVTVFLISLKAGGVALNLTAASRIYLMDPWWNPAAEFQAMDRTHRLGQHRSITVVRFIVRNTVEEKILALQEKKRLVFEGTVGQDSAALARLTEDDMKFLFTH